MSPPPPLNPPQDGRPLSPDLGYVKKASAIRQARVWNDVLRDDPVFGPDSGFTVGVGTAPDRQGWWPLVWLLPDVTGRARR